MVRQPQYSPTIPLITRDPRIPASSPLTSIPTLRALFCGSENCETIGMKICGMTEQTPVTSEAASMQRISGATATASMEQASSEKFITMMFLRL